jgi:hypothetical protein
MLPEWTGEWEVRILDADGIELLSKKFMVGQ